MKKNLVLCCLMIGAPLFFVGAQDDETTPVLHRFGDHAKKECVAILSVLQKKLNNAHSLEQRTEVKVSLEQLMTTIPIGEQKLRSRCSALIDQCDLPVRFVSGQRPVFD